VSDRRVIVPRSRAAIHKLHVAIAKGHYNEHRPHFTFGNQIVENKICLSTAIQPFAMSLQPCSRYSTGYGLALFRIVTRGV